jgi:hypothetical protein
MLQNRSILQWFARQRKPLSPDWPQHRHNGNAARRDPFRACTTKKTPGDAGALI